MLGRVILIGAMLWSAVAAAAEVKDATGRTADARSHRPCRAGRSICRCSAGSHRTGSVRAGLAGVGRRACVAVTGGAKRRQIPRLTGREDVPKDQGLQPDLISTTEPCAAICRDGTGNAAATGIPTILLDGSLAKIPATPGRRGIPTARTAWKRSLGSRRRWRYPGQRPSAGAYARGPDGWSSRRRTPMSPRCSRGWAGRPSPDGQAPDRSIDAIGPWTRTF